MMTNRSDRGSAKPRGSQRFERDDVIRESTCGLHQGQQPCGAAQTGRTHGCTRRCSSLNKSSCAAGVVHTWTYNGRIMAKLRGAGAVHAITSAVASFQRSRVKNRLQSDMKFDILSIAYNCRTGATYAYRI